MHVASLELCKELYELSGWSDCLFGYFRTSKLGGKFGDSWVDDGHVVKTRIEAKLLGIKGLPIDELSDYPAYDLGYLFAQLLPAGTFSVKYVSPSDPGATDLKEWYGKCIAYTPGMRQGDYPVDGSPADALCKLAIELIKQGILKREDSDA